MNYIVFKKMINIRKKVQFDHRVRIILIPYEERQGIWMQYAIKRRIEHADILLSPILLLKLNDMKMAEVNCGK